ncbi:MAG TPA: SDR family oxidoreductase [Candidatus Hydrogenedentes bacterium]|nr:SDR family oxidoreductase [Candidatus Hydrogenedentota bacterium]HOH51267.1 SDR family oxidoreductase [Candidatus Hydrogenedentota bacterium]
MANALIAGYGYVGAALGAALTLSGHTVWGVRRRAKPFGEGVRMLSGDLCSEGGPPLPDVPLDWVFYTASADASTPEAYRRAYVDGPRGLLRALAAGGQSPRRVLFTSSTGVYHQQDGEWVDETSPTEPVTFSGQTLLEGERVFLEGPFPATVVRLAGIYGPGRTRILDEVRSGAAVIRPNERRILNLVHRDDCAGALAFLATQDALASVYCAVDDAPAPRAEVLAWLAARAGVRLAEETSPAEAGEPVMHGGFRRVSNGRLRGAGYGFRFPTWREGFGALMTSGVQ